VSKTYFIQMMHIYVDNEGVLSVICCVPCVKQQQKHYILN